MAARRVFWRLPMVCGATTLAGMALGMAYDGVADIAAAVLLFLPVAVLIRRTRFADHRQNNTTAVAE